jgi:hypothetical protein
LIEPASCAEGMASVAKGGPLPHTDDLQGEDFVSSLQAL